MDLNASGLLWPALQGGLAAALGVAVVRGLKAVARLDGFRPPVGARRVGAALGFGAAFPADRLPGALAARVASGPALFVFAGPGCCVCGPVMASLPYLARDHRGVQFVVLALESWDPFDGAADGRIPVVADVALVEALGLLIQPYAIKTVDGRVKDFGVVNSPEHVESLLESAGRVPHPASRRRA